MKDLNSRLSEFRRKKTHRIIGLMSGTSVDGITTALADVIGTGDSVSIDLLGYKTYPLDSHVRERVFKLFNPGGSSVQDVCEMNFVVGEAFGEAANQLMNDLDVPRDQVDLVGSHGQTIWHQPSTEPVSGYNARSTLQIGEPAVISEKTGLPVVSDFRKADMAVGGEGAPLTPYLDYVLHRDPDENRILQNIGGISNLTFLPAGASPCEVIAFDTGPGNMIIDALMKKYTGVSFDVDGLYARKGVANAQLLEELLSHPYYTHKPPKTTGREIFGDVYSEKVAVRADELRISPEDAVSTVTKLTVETIINAYQTELPGKIDAVYVSGGGAKNPLIIEGLRKRLNAPVLDYSAFGIPGEAKEALLVALLANENVMGTPCNMVAATGARRQVVLGYCTWV
jgi:anhydro-N-acetylmuramic acid kinase